VITLEFLEEHRLTGSTDSIDEHARHSDSGRRGEQFLQASYSRIADGISYPAIASERYPF
jgi:hypothetical protein